MLESGGLEVAPTGPKLPRLSMEDTALPSQAPLVSGSGGHVAASKSESRKRFGLADQFRPRLSRGNLALSRQYSFDVGTDTVDASSPDSLPMDESEPTPGPSPKASNEAAPVNTSGKSFRLQRANSSFPSTTTATALSPPDVLSNGSPKRISSQQVRQRLKEHLLSRRVMSVEGSWGSGGGDSSGGFGVLGASGTPPQTHVALRHFSRSFDSDPTASSPSPPSEANNISAPRPPSPPSLPRKRAAYHRSAAISLELPNRRSSNAAVPASIVGSRTIDEVALAALNSIWREGKPRAHIQQPSLSSGGNAFTPFLKRQASYNPQMAHMCPEDLSKSALNPPNSDTPLDLTAATAVSSNDPVQPLNNECLLLRQASANAPSASVGGVSFLMQQLEALRKASVQKHLVFNPAAFSAPSTLSTIPEPPQLSAASAVVKATITSATSAAAVPASELPGLHETAASLVSSFTSLCQSPTAANPSKQLSFLATSMLQAHLSTQVSQNLRETQENLAALTLGGPSREKIVQSTPPAQQPAPIPPSAMPSTHSFLRAALERAYDELQRHWNSLPTINSWPMTLDRESGEASAGTALLFDPSMLSHVCLCPHGNNPRVHPEHPLRIISILERVASTRLQIPRGLLSSGDQDSCVTMPDGLPLAFFCQWMRARLATREELALFHTEEHIARFCSEESCSSSSEDEGVHDRAMVDDEEDGKPLTTDLSIGTDALKRPVERATKRSTFPLVTLRCGGVGVDSDTVWNPETTSRSARLAVGQVLCLAHHLACGRLRNGFALVHPPGHHAEPDQATGFCYFNSVAIAALSVLRSGLASRVLILDWDIHHGNGTQFAASQHPGLLYISLHRYDQGTFFPGTGAFHCQNSQTNGGCIINIPWGCTDTSATSSTVAAAAVAASARRESWRSATTLTKTISSSNDSGIPDDGSASSSALLVGQSCTSSPTSSSAGSIDTGLLKCCGESGGARNGTVGLSDAEYLAAFRSLVMPIAAEFAPDVVLVSAGFDAAAGHSSALGGYEISPGAFAWMTRQCMSLAKGRVGLVLEGGYVASVTADCVSTCLNALLLPNPPPVVIPSDSSTNLQRLVSLEDSLTTAKAWVVASELSRAPRPEAVKTLLNVAAVSASSGRWKCLSNLDASVSVDFALPFDRAVEQERSRLLSSTTSLAQSSSA